MGNRTSGGASEPPSGETVRRRADPEVRSEQRRSGVRVKDSRNASLSDSPRARERQRRDMSRDWLDEGRAALQRGNVTRALACFTSARSLDGGSKEIAFYAAWVELSLSQDSDTPLRESVQNLARAMLLEDPQHAFAHYVTGELARRCCDTTAARRSLRIAIQLDPDLEAARIALNGLNEQTG